MTGSRRRAARTSGLVLVVLVATVGVAGCGPRCPAGQVERKVGGDPAESVCVPPGPEPARTAGT